MARQIIHCFRCDRHTVRRKIGFDDPSQRITLIGIARQGRSLALRFEDLPERRTRSEIAGFDDDQPTPASHLQQVPHGVRQHILAFADTNDAPAS
jgi:hypothetical protein